MQPAQYYTHPAVTRYFDHIQNRPAVRKSAEPLAPAFSLIPFDLENAPKLAYTPANASVHAYEEELNSILSARRGREQE